MLIPIWIKRTDNVVCSPHKVYTAGDFDKTRTILWARDWPQIYTPLKNSYNYITHHHPYQYCRSDYTIKSWKVYATKKVARFGKQRGEIAGNLRFCIEVHSSLFVFRRCFGYQLNLQPFFSHQSTIWTSDLIGYNAVETVYKLSVTILY